MLSVLVDLLNQGFSGSLERNGVSLGVNIEYWPKDVMVLGPVPADMDFGANIAYIKFQGDTVLASFSLDGEFKAWPQGLLEGVHTLRLLDPRIYAMLLRNGKLEEKDGISIGNGLTRVFAECLTTELPKVLGAPDEVAKVIEAIIAERDEVAFDFGSDQHGRPQSMIRKELSPSADEIAVHFQYP